MHSRIIVVIIAMAWLSCVECGSQSLPAPALEEQWGDPIAATFENCRDLFAAEANTRECAFTDRRERGYDVVEDKVTCKQQTTDVWLRVAPGPRTRPRYELDELQVQSSLAAMPNNRR